MMRASVSVVLVLAMAVVAAAGVPSGDDSYVAMSNNGKGLTTCPSGDAAAYSYITVKAVRADLTPIQGIPAGDFHFTVIGSGSANVTITAFDAETDVNGEIRFEAEGTGTVLYGSLGVTVQIYTVYVNDNDLLWCNTYDYDANGTVNPIDFVTFAADFGTTNERSDFNWDGTVNPVDFVSFAGHFGH